MNALSLKLSKVFNFFWKLQNNKIQTRVTFKTLTFSLDQFSRVYISSFHLFLKREDFIKDQIPQKEEFILSLGTWNLVPNYNFFTNRWYFVAKYSSDSSTWILIGF